MKTRKLKIGNSIFKVHVPTNEQEMKIGLSNFDILKVEEGMLFSGFKQKPVMTMKKMSFPLDMIGLDKDMEVMIIKTVQPEEDNIVFPENIKFILEINAGLSDKLGITTFMKCSILDNLEKPVFKVIGTKNESGKTISKKLELVNSDVRKHYNIKIEDIKPEPGHMQVLGAGGEVLMNIKGGERIFSISHTKKLLELANQNKKKELAKAMVEILDIQDNTEPQYTT